MFLTDMNDASIHKCPAKRQRGVSICHKTNHYQICAPKEQPWQIFLSQRLVVNLNRW